MLEEENVEVTPSDDNGNVPLETPSEQPSEETPAVVETVEPTEPELYELPDGRKVDGETLSKEWKENFLPEFTRKSQALADIEKGNSQTNATEKPFENPEWQPQTYAELIEVAKQEVRGSLQKEQQEAIERTQALEAEVVNQLAEVKKLDPSVNENSLFLHANEYRTKYGVSFPDLQTAYKHMKDTSELTKKVQTTTAANIAKRNDPVSVSPGATGQRPDPGAFENARDYLRSLKG